MSEPSKLGKGLIAVSVFLVSLLLLLAKVLFVVLRRRQGSCQQQDSSGITSDGDQDKGGVTLKELLYLSCLKTQSRVDPVSGDSDEASEVVDDPIDVFKLRKMSMLLFTIKEEELEEEDDLESQKSVSANERGKENVSNCDDITMSTESMHMFDDTGDTPFSTPCVSPSHFSPLTSPAHLLA